MGRRQPYFAPLGGRESGGPNPVARIYEVSVDPLTRSYERLSERRWRLI